MSDISTITLDGISYSIKDALARQQISSLDNRVDTAENDIQSLIAAVGTPLVSSTVAGMTDHSKIYVYVGSESGYVNGNWYYWNGSAWTSGGVYNSTAFETDKTLTVSDAAADAEVVGDELDNLKNAIKTDIVSWSIGALQSSGDSNYMEKDNSKKIRTNEFLRVDGSYNVSCDSDSQYSLRFYNASMIPISGTSWLSAPNSVSSLGTGVYFRVQARYANDSEVSSVSDLSSKISIEGSVVTEEAIAKTNTYVSYGTNPEQNFKASDFIKGYISSGSLYSGGSHSYVTNVTIYMFPYDIVMSLESGYKFIVWKQKADGTWENSGWLTSTLTVKKNTRFRVTISLDPEDGSVPLDIAALVSKLIVSSALSANVANNTNKINEIISSQYADDVRKNRLYDLQNGRMLKIKGINHRGWNTEAPENSIPAFKLSAQHGFNFVETDVQFTSDDVPVLIHNRLINTYARNADGSTLSSNQYVDQNTYEQLLQYDWGIYFSSDYAGLKIAKFEDFIVLCKKLGLHPYIEIKVVSVTFTQAQVESLVDIVSEYDMLNNVTWVSFSDTYLSYIKNVNPNARLGFLIGTVDASAIATALTLKGLNEVFIDTSHYTNEHVQLCSNAGLPMEIYTIDSQPDILSLPSYISGVTSNTLIAGNVIYESTIASD